MLTLLIEEGKKDVRAVLVEGLTPLRKRTLSLLRLLEDIYDLCFTQAKIKGASKNGRKGEYLD